MCLRLLLRHFVQRYGFDTSIFWCQTPVLTKHERERWRCSNWWTEEIQSPFPGCSFGWAYKYGILQPYNPLSTIIYCTITILTMWNVKQVIGFAKHRAYHIISYPIIPCHIILHHIVSCHVKAYHVISRHVVSYDASCKSLETKHTFGRGAQCLLRMACPWRRFQAKLHTWSHRATQALG